MGTGYDWWVTILQKSKNFSSFYNYQMYWDKTLYCEGGIVVIILYNVSTQRLSQMNQ